MYKNYHYELWLKFIKRFSEFLPNKEILIVGASSRNEFKKAHKKTELKQGKKKSNLLKVSQAARKINILIKSKDGNEFKEKLDRKHKFNFIFSDDVARFHWTNRSSDEMQIGGKSFILPQQGFKDILDQLEYLNEGGVISFYLEESALTEMKHHLAIENSKATGIKLEELLNEKGFYINAILGVTKPEDLPLNPDRTTYYQRPYSVFVCSKKETDSYFLGDISCENFNYNKLLDFLFNLGFYNQSDISEEIDLENGFLLDKGSFYTFTEFSARNRVEKLRGVYNKKYKVVELIDLTIDVHLSSDLSKATNNNFIQLLFSFKSNSDKVVSTESIPLSRGPNYVVTFKNEVLRDYVAIFLQSKLGRSLYESYLTLRSIGSGYELQEDNLRKLPIFIPEIDIQREIIGAHNKLTKLQNSIDIYKDGLSLNPDVFIEENIQKIDNMLNEAGQLNDAEMVRAMIRGAVETNQREFKKSWRLPTKGEKGEAFDRTSNELHKTIFKVINSFINTNGGTLVIGIDDDSHEITGIEEELRHFFGKDSPEKRLDKFDHQFCECLSNAFIKQEFLDLVEYRPVVLENKYVWLVTCKQSSRPCLINATSNQFKPKGKIGEFYIRQGANSKPLDGQDRQDYIENRFFSEI